MEEGPEPHEWIEKTVEHQHHGHETGDKRSVMIPAIAAAMLAVLAAIGSLLSGQAANEALLSQTKATNQWAYYQSTSTKGHVYEVSRKVVGTLLEAQGIKQGEKTTAVLKDFQEQVDKYDKRKEKIQEEAKHLQEQSEHELHKHHNFAFGISAFQVGIVLSSISILVRYRLLFVLSLVAGGVGIVFLLMGLLV